MMKSHGKRGFFYGLCAVLVEHLAVNSGRA